MKDGFGEVCGGFILSGGWFWIGLCGFILSEGWFWIGLWGFNLSEGWF